MIGWPVLAFPFLLMKDMEEKELVARYREADTLIQNASSSIGDLLMVYKEASKAFWIHLIVDLFSVESGEEEKEKEIEGEAASCERPPGDEIEFQRHGVLARQTGCSSKT